jgi:hypothetical protein
MPATIQPENNTTYALRISGVLSKSEFDEVQKTMATAIDRGVKPRILTLLENFGGWERGVDWAELDFLFSHSGEIARIAIVGEPRWETEALAFAGAGFRRAPVKFFPAAQLAEARTWLAE